MRLTLPSLCNNWCTHTTLHMHAQTHVDPQASLSHSLQGHLRGSYPNSKPGLGQVLLFANSDYPSVLPPFLFGVLPFLSPLAREVLTTVSPFIDLYIHEFLWHILFARYCAPAVRKYRHGFSLVV